MYKPNAPQSAVDHIIRAFGGHWTAAPPGENEGWLVTFASKEDAMRTRDLISMLRGWSSKVRPDTKNTIQIFSAEVPSLQEEK